MKIRLIKYPLRLIAFVFTILFFSCAVPTRQPSYFDKRPNVLKTQYKPEEAAAIEKNFKVNPQQHSKEYGNLILWRMHQKSPEFALEFAQTPEVVDGVNAQEAKAIGSIYGLIKEIDIPDDLFKKKAKYEKDINKIIIEWQGNSDRKTEWNGFFTLLGNRPGRPFLGKIHDAKPIGFEAGEDKINYEELKNGDLRWESKSAYGDKDGIMVSLEYPAHGKIRFLDINGQTIRFTKAEVVSKEQLEFKDGLEGTLIVKKVSEAGDLQPGLYAIRSMVQAGEGEHRYSSQLQALLWGYMDGKFKEGDNPLETYQDPMEFVKPIWGRMEGPRWEDFDTVTSRLNLPELIDYYTRKKFTYEYYLSHVGSAYAAFGRKGGNCIQIEAFQRYCLNRGGYSARILDVEARSSGVTWHVVTEFVDNGKRFIMDNGTFVPKGIIGPFNSLGETSYRAFVGR